MAHDDTERATQITSIMDQAGPGDRRAASDLLPLVYEELRSLARARMAHEPSDHTLQPTALVHEAYMRIMGDDERAWDSRGHFFAAAARAMRRILIERARRHAAVKHGGGRRRVSFNRLDEAPAADEDAVDLLALDEALSRLEAEDERLADIVLLRYFAGMTIEQTASYLGVSSRTVKRDWTVARAWLHHEIREAGNGDDESGST